MDVKSVYLNGKIDKELYMRQPEGYIDPKHPTKVCKLNKSLCGLKQSAKCSNAVIHSYLSCENYVKSVADPCVYIKTVVIDGRNIFMAIGLC